MRSLLGEVIGWAVTWLPWLGLVMGAGYMFMAVMVVGSEDDMMRDFLLLSIAIFLLTGLFVGLVMVQ